MCRSARRTLYPHGFRMLEEKERTESAILAEDAELDKPVLDDESLPAIIIPDLEAPAPKKKRRFLKGLSIYAAVLLVIGAVAVCFLHANLAKYEAGTTNAALRTYMEWVETKNYEAIFQAAGFEESGLNTKQEYLNYFETLFADAADLSVREKPTTDGSKRYALYSGNKRLVNLVLAVSPEGDGKGWYATTELIYQEPFTLVASDDIRLSVNGTDINLLSLPSKEVQSTVFPTAENAEAALPVLREYTLEGLLNPPTVTALSLSGEACTVDADGQTLRVLLPAAETEKQANQELAIEAATTYAKFVAKDATRTQVLKYVHDDSELNRSIRNFSNVWFGSHESYEFRNITVTNYGSYSSSDFFCTVSFEPIYTKNGKKIEATPVHYRMSFLRDGDEWLLYTLSQATAEESGNGETTTGNGSTATTASAATTTTTTTTTAN